jgi:putative glutamine amidotransferase
MRRPIIGITTYGRDEENRFRLPCLYVDSVRRAGGIAVLIPPGDEPWDELFGLIDGLIFAGGSDVDPSLYGGRLHETISSIDAERDQSELALARRVANSELPTLGICRGHQLLNVALGGTLHEHLPDVVGEEVLHRLPPREPSEHPITVDAESRLAGILGEQEFAAASWHHQAVRDPAQGMVAVARAPDGTIEGCELKSHPWLFTVQWHPELTAHTNATQQRLFDSLVEACRKKIEAQNSAKIASTAV